MFNSKPSYRVTAKKDSNDPRSRLVNIGVGFDNESKKSGEPFVTIRLDSRPWGDWDGTLYLFPLDRVEESDG